MLWLSLGHSPTSGDSGKSGENSWGPAGNLNITFVYVPDHECWNKGFKCNFPGNKSPPGHCQVSPVLFLRSCCHSCVLLATCRPSGGRELSTTLQILALLWVDPKVRAYSQGLIGISGWPQEHWQRTLQRWMLYCGYWCVLQGLELSKPNQANGNHILSWACTFLDLTQTNNADTFMRFFQIKNDLISFGCICTDFLVKGSSSPY